MKLPFVEKRAVVTRTRRRHRQKIIPCAFVLEVVLVYDQHSVTLSFKEYIKLVHLRIDDESQQLIRGLPFHNSA